MFTLEQRLVTVRDTDTTVRHADTSARNTDTNCPQYGHIKNITKITK